ncbi:MULTISPECIES: SDR family NAD(P)-dependent oxidoreductase [Mameliella]|uniref:SDR family NAD(P)-dependent oxidoreductase n=1 Tax=Mameliella TaxID=1434019 RepID=UPI001818F044|nr:MULTISPECIES: SDR family NAD(P)-dependent oxidoreductase [Mameliella]MCR9273169.1 SDR family oxidoreductase [Paracoccaceae bacterium]
MFAGRRVLLTGAAQGIGLALARALAAEGARLFLTDRAGPDLDRVARDLGAGAFAADLRDPGQIAALVADAQAALGGVDMLISNAGFARGAMEGPCSAPDDQWQDSWDLHVMAHLRAARLVLPGMRERGEGWLVNVASAAGLLSQIGDAPYSASKHAAVSLAQSLAIEHGDEGIRVAVVCPLYVATPLLGYGVGEEDRPEGVLTPEAVADRVLQGLREQRFLILPHPEAAEFARRRAADMDRWIDGMRQLRRGAFADGAPRDLSELHRRI